MDSEALVVESHVEPTLGWKKKVGLVAGALGLALVGTAALGSGQTQFAELDGIEGKEERIDIVPSYPACSKGTDNCFATGCCQTSGHKCYAKKHGQAQCNATCTPGVKGFSCGVVGSHSVPVARSLGGKLYCFSVYTRNTGSPKKSYELELLKAQKEHGVSIFACDAWDVFSDVSGNIGDYPMVQVEDVFSEFHRVKRKGTGSWVNWAMFYQVWVKVREIGKWRQGDYVLKVDADAVFVPERMRQWLSTKKGDSPHGVYYENCPRVQYGYFGNLEVMTTTAASVLTTYLEDCHAVFAPCADDGCDWKWGPWGEDVFVQRCMDHHYVDKAEGFDMTTDGACEAHRPAAQKKNKKWHATDCSQVSTPAAHPFKKPEEYLKCLGEMTGQHYRV